MDAAGLLQLLFSGRGRIGRVAYFLGVAIALVVMVGPVLIAIYKKAPREVSPILITFVLLGA
jgi:uncharacterized membrane protein YhaH (DUF805 family)